MIQASLFQTDDEVTSILVYNGMLYIAVSLGRIHAIPLRPELPPETTFNAEGLLIRSLSAYKGQLFAVTQFGISTFSIDRLGRLITRKDLFEGRVSAIKINQKSGLLVIVSPDGQIDFVGLNRRTEDKPIYQLDLKKYSPDVRFHVYSAELYQDRLLVTVKNYGALLMRFDHYELEKDPIDFKGVEILKSTDIQWANYHHKDQITTITTRSGTIGIFKEGSRTHTELSLPRDVKARKTYAYHRNSILLSQVGIHFIELSAGDFRTVLAGDIGATTMYRNNLLFARENHVGLVRFLNAEGSIFRREKINKPEEGNPLIKNLDVFSDRELWKYLPPTRTSRGSIFH